jgi:uncharacterized protein YecT (DUF1311 family)
MVRTAVVGLVLSFSGQGNAGAAGLDFKEVEVRYSSTYRNCPGFRTAIDPEMLACISAEYALQDQRLNQAYAKAMTGLNAQEKARLRAAQKAWLTYRDDWCGITYDEHSGSLERIMASQCTLRETVLQTMRLEALN